MPNNKPSEQSSQPASTIAIPEAEHALAGLARVNLDPIEHLEQVEIPCVVFRRPKACLIGINDLQETRARFVFNGVNLVLKLGEVEREFPFSWPTPEVQGDVIERMTCDLESVFLVEFDINGHALKEHAIEWGSPPTQD